MVEVLTARWSLRVRLVSLAIVTVTVVLVVAGLLMGAALRRSWVGDLAEAAAVRSQDLATSVGRGGIPEPVPVGEADETLVQVVRAGAVVGGSGEARSLPPIDLPRPAPGATTVHRVGSLPIDDDDEGFVVAGTTTADGVATVWVATSLEDVEEAVARAGGSAWLVLPIAVVLLAATTWVLVGRALAPVEAIRRETEAISGTALDRRVPASGRPDEIGRLAQTLNRMLDRLEDASGRQRQFVSDAAHELRTPVATVRTRVETALASSRVQVWPDVAGDVLAETRRMERLIEQLLLLARVDAGRLEASTAAVDLDEVVDRVASTWDRSGELQLDLDGVRPVQIVGDDVLLEQVVRNLLANAADHAASRVVVGLGAGTGRAVLTVEDDGHGIPEEHRASVLDRFVRLDSARARPGGSGLGLAIVRDIVAAHGGTVVVEASDLGGARLRVDLPRTPAD